MSKRKLHNKLIQYARNNSLIQVKAGQSRRDDEGKLAANFNILKPK